MRFIKHILLFITYGTIGIVSFVILFYVFQLQNQGDLKLWHTEKLDAEFDVTRTDEIQNFDDYINLEQQLFTQLNNNISAKLSNDDKTQLNRFNPGSRTDPNGYPFNWNRTVNVPAAKPKGGVLLLHGLSDSPYSMRALAEIFQSLGFSTLSLRLPGHGTAPSGLLSVTWRDFTAATRLAARYLSEQVGEDKPLFIVGYSNGAALAVEYSLAALQGEALPKADGLILISPAIGVPPVAALAIWQSRLARIAGLEKLAWTSVLPEFDPFKYNSFAVNAGNQLYQTTKAISDLITQQNQGKGVEGFPRILAFQSVVDATVPPNSIIDRLFRNLAPEGHELVLFDINRYAEAKQFLVADPETLTKTLLSDAQLPFRFTLVTNITPDTNDVVALDKVALSTSITKKTLHLAWPKGIISLSHIALPFPVDDPLYGNTIDENSPGVHLGRIEIRGERGVLLLPANYLFRQRFNPFFPYLKQRLEDYVKDVSAKQDP